MNTKKIAIILVIVVIVLSGILFFVKKNGNYEIYTVEREDFIEKVEFSGRVSPSQEIDLSFELVGKASGVYVDTGDFVKQGDLLAELNTSEINSEINEFRLNLEKEKAKLLEVSGDFIGKNRLQNESETLLNNLKKSYVVSDDIVRNTVDVFFDNPDLRFPEFSNALSNFFLRKEINNQRKEIGNLLKEWNEILSGIKPLNLTNNDVEYSINNLKQVEKLLSLISSGVDDFDSNSNISQSQISSYISSISNARNSIANLIIDLNNGYDNYRDVQAELPVLEFSVENAEASVQTLAARREKYILRAPFDGIITDKDIEFGQVVSAGESVISMISDNSFEIEGFIPEINIIGVEVGDIANVVLDAFGPEFNFEAIVSQVDPRETIKDGITTYRTIVDFIDFNPEIRSGMTTDVKIQKDFIENQIVIPKYLVLEDDQGSYVYLSSDDGKKKNQQELKKYLKLGKTDGSGGVIVSEGLKEGDKIIIQK